MELVIRKYINDAAETLQIALCRKSPRPTHPHIDTYTHSRLNIYKPPYAHIYRHYIRIDGERNVYRFTHTYIEIGTRIDRSHIDGSTDSAASTLT